MKRFCLTLSTLMAVFLLSLTPLYAGQTSNSSVIAQSLIHSSGKRSLEQVKKKEANTLVQNAVTIYDQTQNVILMIAHNQLKLAQNTLSRISKEIDELSMQVGNKEVPIGVTVYEITGVTNVKTAKKIIKRVKAAIKANNLVLARELLEQLRDEIVIDTKYLPINIFKQAVKLAQEFLKKGDPSRAIDSLNIAIYSIDVQTTIIPKPLAEAAILVSDAYSLYKSDKSTALKLLDAAEHKITLARALGYIPKGTSVKELISKIEELKASIERASSKSGEEFYNLKKTLKKAKEGITYKK